MFNPVKLPVMARPWTAARLFSTSRGLGANIRTRSLTSVPVTFIGVVNNYYVPPKITSAPISKWPRLILRRLALFAANTYSVVKLRRDTSIKPKFNQWKDDAIDIYVKTNKAFAKRNLQPLNQIVGKETVKVLEKRMATLPNQKISWKLNKLEENPKVVSFLAVPDEDSTTGVCQMCLKLVTSQTTTVGDKEFNRKVEEYLIYTVNPFTDEVALVGKVFPSDFERGLVDENFDQTDPIAFQKVAVESADIFRTM